MKTFTAPAPYGYHELRQVQQRNMMLAMLLAISIQIMIIEGYNICEWLKQDDTIDPPARYIPFNLLQLPPSLTHNNPSLGTAVIPKTYSVGTPVPVPDCDVDSKIEFTPYSDLLDPKASNNPVIEDKDEGKVIVIPPDPNDPSPDVYQPMEKDPVPVVVIAPKYPEVTIRAGLEGKVIVKVLITKEGKVKKAIIAKSDGDLFVQPALDAAMKWVFTPALMNGKPVVVWVSIPFRFRLARK